MEPQFQLITRICLGFIWLSAAFASFTSGYQIGQNWLTGFGLSQQHSHWLIIAGATTDATIGILVLSRIYEKAILWLQVIVIISYTVLVSIIAPSLWLDPFGSITKNLPILLLIVLYARSIDKSETESKPI